MRTVTTAFDDDDESVSQRGHDPHFLSRLERISLPHVELAMSLYRDPGLLRYILDNSRVAQGAERSAIALRDGGDGPYLVVARDGHFVTCLGAGMSTGDLPVISRGQLDALSEKIVTLRERIELTKAEGGGRAGHLLLRVFEAGPALAREEVVALSVWQKLLADEYLDLYRTATRRAIYLMHELRRIDKLGPRDEPALHAFWGAVWAIGHLSLLWMLDRREEIAEWPVEREKAKMMIGWRAVRSGVVGVAMRGAWAAGYLGKAVIGPYKTAWMDANTPMQLYDKGMALLAIAARTSALRAEVAKTLRRPHGPVLGDPDGAIAKWVGGTLANLTEGADPAPPDPGGGGPFEIGAGIYRTMAKETDAPQFTRDEDVPPDYALAAFAATPFSFIKDPQLLPPLFVSIPWIARAQPEGLYFPREIVDLVLPKWNMRDSIHIISGHLSFYGAKRPQRAEEKPGRNAACSCGSGKKYKKCCGA